MEQKSKHQFTENGVMGTRKEWGETTKKSEGGFVGWGTQQRKTTGGQISQEEEEGQREP